MPQFSVVIPLYNKKNFIKKTIESVLDQTFGDFEIIVIDDCSTDLSLLEVEKIYSTKLKLLKHSHNQGLSTSRNTGIQNATGKFIAFLDADDLWKENFLAEIFTLITQFPEAQIFATNYEENSGTDNIILPNNNAQNFSENSLITNYFEIALRQPLYCYSSVCFNKSVFDKIGLFNPKITFAEDIDFNIRANLVFTLAYSNKALVQYITFSENQITQHTLRSKTLVDLDFYEDKSNIALKKYLDFHRYVFYKMYKLEGNTEMCTLLKKNLNSSNLNFLQKTLLFSPLWSLQFIKILKNYWLKNGVRITTYT